VPLSRLADAATWAPVSARVSTRLGGAEQRVADSLLLMGLAARLWYATLVPAAEGDALLDPACVLVTDDHGALRLGLREPAGWSGASAREVAEVVVTALDPVVRGTRLPDGLAWGNVASALLGLRGVVAGISGWVVEALTHDRLVGTTSPGGRRRSCCLFYRVPGGGLCADCCLDHVPADRGSA
jgi:iron complex transport system ATP-binding protein